MLWWGTFIILSLRSDLPIINKGSTLDENEGPLLDQSEKEKQNKKGVTTTTTTTIITLIMHVQSVSEFMDLLDCTATTMLDCLSGDSENARRGDDVVFVHSHTSSVSSPIDWPVFLFLSF